MRAGVCICRIIFLTGASNNHGWEGERGPSPQLYPSLLTPLLPPPRDALEGGMSQWSGAQPSNAVSHPIWVKNGSVQTLAFRYCATHNDGPSYVKYSFGSMYVLVTLFGSCMCWGGGCLPPLQRVQSPWRQAPASMAFITHSNRPPTASATYSNRLSNRLWGHLCGPFPSTASLPTHTQDAQDASHFHMVIEAMRAVQYKMSRTLGDPPAAAQSDAWAQWMTDRVAASAASRGALAMTPRCARDTAAPPTDCGPDAAPSPAPKAIATDEDTVGVALVDPRGMGVALIQSNCLSFGAGLVAPGLGFPPPMILWGILWPKPHLRYRTGSETAAVRKICKIHCLNTFDSLAQKCGCVRTLQCCG